LVAMTFSRTCLRKKLVGEQPELKAKKPEAKKPEAKKPEG